MKADWQGRWKGRQVVCIASGPSLTDEDIAAVRRAAHPVIVTNTTFRLCPWAEVLFGFDGNWWKEYKAEVDAGFSGAKLTCSMAGARMGIPSLRDEKWFEGFGNSGAAAISLAVVGEARRVVLLGFDCQRTDGKTHWHGDHPKTLGNARSIGNWPKQFKNVARFAREAGVEVVNSSRQTALTCFTRAPLEAVL
jgi:hypothetical protein